MFRSSLLFLSLLCTCSLSLSSQSYSERYDAVYSLDDPDTLFAFLQEWEEAEPLSPQLANKYMDFYYPLLQKENQKVRMIFADTSRTKEQNNELAQPVFYQIDTIIKEPLNILNRAINANPTRLELYIYRANIYGIIEDWSDFSEGYIQILEANKRYKDAWVFGEHGPLSDLEFSFEDIILDVQAELFKTNNSSILPYLRNIALAYLEQEPKSNISMFNISYSYMCEKDFKEAHKWIDKAEKIVPDVVNAYIYRAYCYKWQGDKKNAIKYFTKVSKQGNVEQQQDANENLLKLKK